MCKDRVIVQTASPDDLASVVAMLDQEFVYRKQRTLSFVSRYPAVYCLDNIANIYVIREAHRIVSSVAVKRRKWLANGRVFQFAMVGGVCTEALERERGLASAILQHVEASLREAGLDFAVLWTSTAPFYEKLGWHLSDEGLLGTLQGRILEAKTAMVNYGPLVPEDIARLDAIRAQRLPCRVIREAIDYQTIPLPAQMVERFAVKDDSQWTAYAVVGRLNDTGYVYEVVGDSATFPPLWSAIGEAYQAVCVNDCVGSPSARWLDTHGLVRWTSQNLAMWQILSPRLTMEQVQGIYVSFLDRI